MNPQEIDDFVNIALKNGSTVEMNGTQIFDFESEIAGEYIYFKVTANRLQEYGFYVYTINRFDENTLYVQSYPNDAGHISYFIFHKKSVCDIIVDCSLLKN